MSSAHNHDRLSWGDALFLYLERAGMPLNIASLSVFEGAISLQKCRQFIASKLPLIPRYVDRVVAPPFNIGLPVWEKDPDFDLRRHVRQTALKHGTDSDLKEVFGKILSTTMDRQHPLWDLVLVSGLKGNRTGIIMRAHHCLADGVAGVGLMNVIMDQSPNAPPLPRKKGVRRKTDSSDPFASILELWMNMYSGTVQRVLEAQSEVLTVAERMVAGSRELRAADYMRLVPELTMPTDPLFFNVNYRGPQKFAWGRIPMEEIKAIRTACDVTHNDVVLALVTSTIRQYVELHGESVKGRLLKIMVPVNLRGNGNSGDLGNRISIVPFSIPLGIKSPRRLLHAVHERTEFLKRAHLAELVTLAGGVLAVIPTALQAAAGPIASELPITPFNLVCTNVPGPKFPLYLLGHKMLDWYPYVPVGGNMPLNCAILSYNGTSYFGFAGDVHAAPHLGRVEGLLKSNFAELKKAAGVKSSRVRRVQRKPQLRKVEPELPVPPRKPVAVAPPPKPPIANTIPEQMPVRLAGD